MPGRRYLTRMPTGMSSIWARMVVAELLYGDAQASADIQVPQVEDLLAQEPDALILVPMGAAALSAPVERAMMQGVPVVLCASAVETNNFVTEVGTNLWVVGASLAQYVVDQLGRRRRCRLHDRHPRRHHL